MLDHAHAAGPTEGDRHEDRGQARQGVRDPAAASARWRRCRASATPRRKPCTQALGIKTIGDLGPQQALGAGDRQARRVARRHHPCGGSLSGRASGGRWRGTVVTGDPTPSYPRHLARPVSRSRSRPPGRPAAPHPLLVGHARKRRCPRRRRTRSTTWSDQRRGDPAQIAGTSREAATAGQSAGTPRGVAAGRGRVQLPRGGGGSGRDDGRRGAHRRTWRPDGRSGVSLPG